MLGRCGHIALIALNQEHYLPHGKRAPLDIGLSARSGIAKVDEREFRSPEALLNQPSTCIAGRPPVPIGHSLEAVSALRWQAHADDDGTSLSHEISPYNVSIVSIVAFPGSRGVFPDGRLSGLTGNSCYGSWSPDLPPTNLTPFHFWRVPVARRNRDGIAGAYGSRFLFTPLVPR